MVPKKFADFEALHSKLTEKFPSTILPPLPRKTLITSENVVKERKLSFEKFLNLIAVTNKLATCSEFLEFLGVNAIKAGKFRKDVDDTGEKEESEKKTNTDEPKEEEQTGNIFDEADEEDTDLFMTETQKEDSDMFASTDYIDKQDNTRLFEGPDLGGGIDEDDEDLFFIPGSKEPAIITKTVTTEDNSDLLQIEDDLDKFLDIDDKTDKEEPKISEPIDIDDKTDKEEPKISEPIAAKPKPVPRQKPTIHKKPDVPSKPTIPSKPALPSKPSSAPKPTPRPKPNLLKKPGTDKSNEPIESTRDTNGKGNNSTEKTATSLQTSDILQYIEANKENEDVDLFS